MEKTPQERAFRLVAFSRFSRDMLFCASVHCCGYPARVFVHSLPPSSRFLLYANRENHCPSLYAPIARSTNSNPASAGFMRLPLALLACTLWCCRVVCLCRKGKSVFLCGLSLPFVRDACTVSSDALPVLLYELFYSSGDAVEVVSQEFSILSGQSERAEEFSHVRPPRCRFQREAVLVVEDALCARRMPPNRFSWVWACTRL